MESPHINTPDVRSQTACGDNQASNIDHIFEALKRHEHPFILVGTASSRWMGSRGCFDEAFDIVVRNHQLIEVVHDLIQTGHWVVFDAQAAPQENHCLEKFGSNDQRFLNHCCEADAVLERVDQHIDTFARLRLWSEDSYRIRVDECPLVEVPDLYAWNTFLVEEKYHPASNRTDGWWYGPDTLTNTQGHIVLPPNKPRGRSPNNTTPIFIPSIPTFLDALVDQKRLYKAGCKPALAFYAGWQLNNLTRYLYLELPHQKNTIQFEVEARNEGYLEQCFVNFKRKPFYVIDIQSRQPVLANVWDPDSYPESFCKRRKAKDRLVCGLRGRLKLVEMSPQKPSSATIKTVV